MPVSIVSPPLAFTRSPKTETLDSGVVLTGVYPGLTLEVAARGFSAGGQHPDKCGPSGIVFIGNGALLVANCGTGELFRVPGDGSGVGEPLTTVAELVDLAFGRNGALFGSRGTELVELDPSNGAITRTVAGGFGELAGLSVDTDSGNVVAADFLASSLLEINPETGERRVRARSDLLGSPDGLVVDNSGNAYLAGYSSKHVVVVGRDGAVEDLGSVPGGPDGVALGSPRGPFAGSVIVNQRDGRVVALGAGGSLTTMATGGTPGDLAAVDSDGFLYVTQYEEIIRIGPPWFAPQPWRTLASGDLPR